jgi:hypothetical protein
MSGERIVQNAVLVRNSIATLLMIWIAVTRFGQGANDSVFIVIFALLGGVFVASARIGWILFAVATILVAINS